jgi:hypothetical protein
MEMVPVADLRVHVVALQDVLHELLLGRLPNQVVRQHLVIAAAHDATAAYDVTATTNSISGHTNVVFSTSTSTTAAAIVRSGVGVVEVTVANTTDHIHRSCSTAGGVTTRGVTVTSHCATASVGAAGGRVCVRYEHGHC